MPLLFLLPAGVLVIAFFIWPVVNTILLSLTNLSTANFGNPDFVGLDNYSTVLSDRWMPRILGNSVFYLVATLAFFNLGLALVIAVSTSFIPQRAADGIRLFWLLPRITSPVVFVLIIQGLLAPGPYGVLSQLTGVSQSWINAYPWTVIVFANGIIGASFGMLIFTASIKSIPDEQFQAAAVDGASQMFLVRRVILPQLRWPILFVTAYQSLALLSSFEYIMLLTNGGPGFYTTEVWSLWAYSEAFQSYSGTARFGLGSAMVAGLVVVALIVSLIILRLFRFNDLVTKPKIEVN
ncbi:sugar ABC transporter permease [Fodinicurvata sp. EGI_FJ10296]|uniref:carbohydrate ABC transporter permease n=1 Tax=Fodinicurvata sp. EGI_FJ10296 TaxID=3231908 RepID=UPI0034570E98